MQKGKINLKKNFAQLFTGFCSLALILSLVACGNNSSAGSSTGTNNAGNSSAPQPADNGQVYTLKICHLTSQTDPMHLGFAYLKELLEERSDGRITVEIFSNGSIASSDTETVEKVQQNICQMTAGPAYAAAALGNVPQLKIFDYPYLFEDYDALYQLLDSDLFQTWASELESQTGVRLMGGYTLGWNGIMSAKTPLNTYRDLSGLKIRTMSTDLQMAFINNLGAGATPISYGETYTACQQGTVDGLMTSIGLMVSDRFYEVNKYLLVPKAMANVHTTELNAEWYNSLPDDLRQIFDECYDEYQAYEREAQEEYVANALQTLADNGVTVVEPTDAELEELENLAATVYEQYPDAAGEGTVESVRQLLGK